VETGWLPPHRHRERTGSINRAAAKTRTSNFPIWIWCWYETRRDNLAASFSPELVDLCILW